MKVFFTLSCVLLFLYMSSPINPLDPNMYNFHDETQLARVNQFILNLKSLHIPPRLAPSLSFGLGFPLFNFYAQASYWFTSLPVVLGSTEVFALKLSFFLALCASFFGMYLFLRIFFEFYSSWVGAALFVSATYFATEIVIRGNLAEAWFLALFPLSLLLLYKNSAMHSRSIFFLTAIMLSLLFTVHNIFSLMALPLVIGFSLFFPEKKRNGLAILLALFLGSYFLIPSLFESRLTAIPSHITGYDYKDHFLCVWQLWQSNGWNFGPSLPGCEEDQMSFKIGKIQLVIGLLGIVYFFIGLIRSRTIERKQWFYIAVLSFTFLSLFMTLYQSEPVWTIFSKITALFQFPWRFVAFGMVGLAFFGAFLFDKIRLSFKPAITIVLIAILFISGKKYFTKPLFTPSEYNEKYNSRTYIAEKMAYMMPEYISPHADYQYWRSLERGISNEKRQEFVGPVVPDEKIEIIKNEAFEKIVKVDEQKTVLINIHYFPYWKLLVNNQEIIPKNFDKLGRPILHVASPSEIVIKYSQTPLEKFSNGLSVTAFIVLLLLTFRKRLKDPFLITLLTITVPLFFFKLFSSFRMPANYNYDADFGRDLLRMYELLHGKLTLIGPQLNFSGLHMAPYSFYIFAPFLFIGGFDYRAVLFANALFFTISSILLYIFLKRKWGKPYTFLSILWLITTPYIILAGRSAGNAFSYLPFFACVAFFLFLSKKIAPRTHFLLGIVEGIVINFHPVNSIVIFPAHLVKIFTGPGPVRLKLKNTILTILGITATIVPILLFDIRHDFIITRSFINVGTYQNLAGVDQSSINSQTVPLIAVTLAGLLVITIISFVKTRKKSMSFFGFICVGTANVLLFLVLGKAAVHYFFPVILLLQIILICVNSFDRAGKIYMVLLILVNIFTFPTVFYTPARNLADIEKNFAFVEKNHIIPPSSLNVVLINETHLSKVGYEYRFMLKKHGYAVDDEYSYTNSKYLLLVSEKGDIDWEREKSWELSQFGDKILLKKLRSGYYTYYIFKKSDR